MEKEKCVLCGNQTNYNVDTHIDLRIGYEEGVGQYCLSCHRKSIDSGKKSNVISISDHAPNKVIRAIKNLFNKIKRK